jgi:hypothetical protein
MEGQVVVDIGGKVISYFGVCFDDYDGEGKRESLCIDRNGFVQS